MDEGHVFGGLVMVAGLCLMGVAGMIGVEAWGIGAWGRAWAVVGLGVCALVVIKMGWLVFSGRV